MGCAYIEKIDIKTKDLDLLNGQITNPHRKEINNDSSISPKKVSSKIYNIEKFKFRNLEKTKNIKENNKIKEIKRKSNSLNNLNEIRFSGPIISLLKNKVDNHKKNILTNKVIILNNKTYSNKGN